MINCAYSDKGILALITELAAAKTQQIYFSFVCNHKL